MSASAYGYRGPVYRCANHLDAGDAPDAVALAVVQIHDDDGTVTESVLVPLCATCERAPRKQVQIAVERGWRPALRQGEAA